MNINAAFRNIFSTDMNLITDDVSQIQLEINAEHNAKLFGTRSMNHEIMTTHDEIMKMALTPRQLRG